MNQFDVTVNEVLAEDWKSTARNLAGAAAVGLSSAIAPMGNVQAAPPKEAEQAAREEAKFSVINPSNIIIPANALPSFRGIVVHHTAGNNLSAKAIDRIHRTREKDPFVEIGYNYVIQKNGVVEKGRSLTKPGAHTGEVKPNKWWPKGIPSKNSSHIGIVLVKAEGEPATPAQIKSLETLIGSLYEGIKNVNEVISHHNKCPGPEVEPILRKMNSVYKK